MTLHIEKVFGSPKKIAVFWKGALFRTVCKTLFEKELAGLPKDLTQEAFIGHFTRIEEKICKRYALFLLSQRALLSCDLEKKLIAKGISTEIIQSTLELCKNQGYLDDGVLIQRWIEKERKKGRSGLLIQSKLIQKTGMDDQRIRSLFSSDLDSDEKALDRYLAKQAKQLKSGDRSQRLKMSQKLFRLGFSPDLIRKKVFFNEDDN